MNFSELITKLDFNDQTRQILLDLKVGMSSEKLFNYVIGLTSPNTYESAYNGLIGQLSDDKDGLKMLKIMLFCACLSYKKYQDKNIPEKIFIDTFNCFPRFLGEYYQMYGKLGFDRGFWTGRQLSLLLFRIGELEYELTRDYENNLAVAMHMPSNCDLDEACVKASVLAAREFLKTYYPQYANLKFVTTSWLLSSALPIILPPTSKIIAFQNMFEILNETPSTDYKPWVFNGKDLTDKDLPLKTSLQRALKDYLAGGGIFTSAFGILKDFD